MGKALVIKGANFATNKVTTVTFADIHCTGISFASDTISINGLGTATVDYTVTPANTTDDIIWTSSDTSVLTVADGVITVVSLGTATVTATCGEYSATATVIASLEYIENFQWYSGSYSSNHVGGGVNYSRLSIVGGGAQAAQYGMGIQNSSELMYPVRVPNGVSAILIGYDTSKSSMIYNATGNCTIRWFSDEPSGDSGYDNYAKYLSSEEYNIRNASGGKVTLEIPEGANTFFATIRTTSTYTASDEAATIAAELGLTVEFA